MEIKQEEKRTRELWPQAESVKMRQTRKLQRYFHLSLPLCLLLPRLPHQNHELNTADMNASKLEKVGIQLNHVANSTDMTASFLSTSLVTTELNQTFS